MKTKFPHQPKISLHDRHRENLIIYFLIIGTPLILAFTIYDWLMGSLDEVMLDLVLVGILLVAAIMRRRVENPQLIYRVVMVALGLNFLYILATNEGLLPALLWNLAFILPAVILLGVREGLAWIILIGAAIIAILNHPSKADFIDPSGIIIFATIYLAMGFFSLFSEYVRQQTARLLAVQKNNLESINETILEKAQIDPLTNTFNRSYLTEIFPSKISAAASLARPLSIILLDIDQFKEINDTYGHHIGDRVLTKISGSFRAQLRGASDDLVRLGGDEFLIVLPDTKLEHAVSLAKRLRKSAEELQISDKGFKVTCSMGVVQLEEIKERRTFLPDQAIRDLIKQGDKCMYEAKRRGKNLVISNYEQIEE